VNVDVEGEVWFWRGPAPWHFVTVPEEGCAALELAAPGVTYGWGMVPVTATLGRTTWKTSLWPKDGGYIVPLKTSVRRAEGVDVGDTVAIRLTVDV